MTFNEIVILKNVIVMFKASTNTRTNKIQQQQLFLAENINLSGKN